MADQVLKFSSFVSSPDAGFWHALSQKKLNEYRLDDKPHSILGYYTMASVPDAPTRLCISGDSFNEPSEFRPPGQSFVAQGTIHNTNTLDAFKALDLADIATQAANNIWADIESGAAIDDSSLLSRFVVVTFADLKKYHFHYWFCFPAIKGAVEAAITAPDAPPAVPIATRFAEPEVAEIIRGFTELAQTNRSLGHFGVVKGADFSIKVVTLRELVAAVAAGTVSDVTVGFADPSGLAEHSGWPLRNLLALLAHHLGSSAGTRRKVSVIALRHRSREGVVDASSSIVIDVLLPVLFDAAAPAGTPPSHVKGWEKNSKNVLSPRLCNLSSTMDPLHLASSAVSLNLSLMRWRLMPCIDLEKIQGLRCLLLGAGTLGCNVARTLMGWGVKKLTLVDNGNVSFSNPVRQTLFDFEDSLNGGKPKAEAAAEQLRKIFPGMETTGINMAIPMPGHAVPEGMTARVQADVKRLEDLVDSHDVVFLLMDTRESRWLPTLMCAARNKLCLNAALGFDTFVAMRHGVQCDAGARNVGCYFCNDVMAPSNSTKDRTLDQQCTVSRPGLSMIASAMIVELMVSLLHHPLGAAAPSIDEASKSESVLGAVPHQLRGALSSFGTLAFSGQAFDKCTACSRTIVSEYQKDGFACLLKAFNSPSYLEDLTGLTQMFNDTDKLDTLDFAMSEDEFGSEPEDKDEVEAAEQSGEEEEEDSAEDF